MVEVGRDRAIIVASLVAIVGVAWAYLLGLGQAMSGMDDMPGMAMETAGASFLLTTTMWSVMMVGMMLPGAAPMILLFTMVQRKQGTPAVLATSAFVVGYIIVWGGFAIIAASLQMVLAAMAFLSPSLTLVSARVGGATFLAAAIYEFSPIKRRCLTQCINPLQFVTSHWRPGVGGAFRMGVTHGAFCLGCCWALMLLLFAAGVMNLFWVAALAVLVLLQKMLPNGRMTTTVTGTVMLGVGVILLLR